MDDVPTTANTSSSRPQAAQPKSAPADDDDEEMWDAVMADFPDEPYVPPERQPAAVSQAKPSVQAADEDEDMWDIVREMEAESAAKATAGAHPPGPPSEMPPSDGTSGLAGVDPTRRASNDEGWDEMYA